MATDPAEFKRRRLTRLRSAGISEAAVVYLADLEAAGALEQPIASLEALLRQPRWPGRRVYLARTGQQLEFDGRIWRLTHS